MIDNSRAAYRVLDPAGFFSDTDSLYAEGEEIYFDGEPNDQLEPLNQIAKDKLVAYLNRLDDQAREAAAKLGRHYSGRPRTLDGGLELATALQRNNVSVMGAKDKQTSTEKINQDVAETGSINKRGRGRPRKDLVAA